MGYILGGLRLLLLFITTALMVGAYSVLTLFMRHTDERGFRLRRIIIILLLKLLGFRIKIEGLPVTKPALYVCNHKGVFDFLVVLRYLDAFVVSKSELSKIPVLHKGGVYTGIIYVKRDNRESRSAVRETIRQTLVNGKNVLIYPEGTTHNGRTTMEFKIGAFVEAAKSGIPVVPIALEYKNRHDYYVNIPALKMFFRSFNKLWTQCSLSFGPPVSDTDPELLCAKTRSWIDQKLLDMQLDLGHKYD